MKHLAAALILVASLVARAAEEKQPETQPASTQQQPNARERFVAAAKTVKMRSDAKAVEEALANLGKPSVSFKWCNRAGCVDKSSEVGSNRMYVNYSEIEGEKNYGVLVMFCTESPGEWQVALTSASIFSTKSGAFGTIEKPESLYRDMDTRVAGCMAGR